MNKIIIDLITRSFFSQIKTLLVNLFNESNRFVKKTHESKRNQEILIKKVEKQKKTEKQKKIEKQKTQQIEQTQQTQKIQKIENQMKQKENIVSSEKRKRKLSDRFDDHVNNESKRRKIQHASSNEKFITSSYAIDDDDDDEDSNDENIIDSDYVNTDSENDVISDFEDEQKNATVLKIIIVKLLKTQYAKLNKAEQKQFSQKKMNLRRLLKLSSTKIYTKKNLDDFETLDRALRLLFVVRFDQMSQHIRINSHVEYDRLSRLILNIIHVKMKKENAQLQKYLNIFNDSRFILFNFHI
jgi:hypothetical protein